MVDRKFLPFDDDYDFSALFAFCDLHVSRWKLWTPLERLGARLFDRFPDYFDRQGFPIQPDPVTGEACIAWAKLKEDIDYSRVAQDDLPDGSRLSTVWLGMNHGWGGEPMIFETMRFAPDDYGGIEFESPYDGVMTDCLRYPTEEEALATHHEIVRRIRVREGH